ncbi:hypothetical protein F503_04608 [Ophiostoma piceae UAMH 11346]|uniref:Uncharacterized protein n=1 Tax=Ophiostoma piceae (strain UAMH 11346) TaxID=1262450 RepID=S3CAR7_OPHP1|nr:hypothetical protein F503_04608 [Ophiostoma piceae UAMH 11346]
MVSITLARVLLFASMAAAVPLNINLGAYSPAIVVGDGAIEFSGGKAAEVAKAAALKSGSGSVVEAAVPAVATVAASENSPGVSIVQANAADSSILSEPASLPLPGSKTKELDPRL